MIVAIAPCYNNHVSTVSIMINIFWYTDGINNIPELKKIAPISLFDIMLVAKLFPATLLLPVLSYHKKHQSLIIPLSCSVLKGLIYYTKLSLPHQYRHNLHHNVNYVESCTSHFKLLIQDLQQQDLLLQDLQQQDLQQQDLQQHVLQQQDLQQLVLQQQDLQQQDLQLHVLQQQDLQLHVLHSAITHFFYITVTA